MKFFLFLLIQLLFSILTWRLYAELWRYYFKTSCKDHAKCRVMLWLVLFIPTFIIVCLAQYQVFIKTPQMVGL